MILREIITKLGFQIDDKKLFKFNDAIAQVKDNLNDLGKHADLAKKAFFGLTGTATALGLLSLHTAKYAQSTDRLAESLGITAQELQSTELAAQSMGIGVNELSDSMTAFHKKLGDLGNGNTEASREMNRLGVSFTGANGKIKSSFQLYEELAQKIDSIKSPIARASALQKVLGTDNIELARIFKNGGEALRQQREEIEKIGYVIDSKGIKSSKDYIKSWAEFQIIVSSVKKELSIKFMPVFNNMIKVFKGWFIENRKLISQNISSFINVLSIALSVLLKALQIIIAPINMIIELFGGFENAASVLGIALGLVLAPRIWASVLAFRALTVAMLTNPITWITAAIAALGLAIGLLVNDLWHWSEGNDSVIGRVLGSWTDFKESFFEIVDSITGYFSEQFKQLGGWFTDWIDTISNKISSLTGKAQVATSKLENKALAQTTESGLKVYTSNSNRFRANQPLLNPSSPTGGVVSNNNFSTDRKVNQYITENITVTVPTGTTSEQSRVIATQVAEQIQIQFNANMQIGADALSGR